MHDRVAMQYQALPEIMTMVVVRNGVFERIFVRANGQLNFAAWVCEQEG